MIKEEKKHATNHTDKVGLIKEYLLNSYNRCSNYDIDKDMIISKNIITGEELNKVLLGNIQFMAIAKPFTDQLYDFVKGSEFLVILTDRDGCILSIVGDEKILKKASSYRMEIGAYMSEEAIGTNAMGTSIAEDMAVQISGDEHFIKAYHTWTCSGAPIHNENGEIIASLDLTGNCKLVHSHTLGMVVAAAKSIESSIILESKNQLLNKNNLLVESLINSIQEGILYCDLQGNILISNKQASSMFGYSKKSFASICINDIMDSWDDVKNHCLKLDELNNEDVMVIAKTNKLYFNLNAYPVIESGEAYGVILTFNDIKKVRKLASKIFARKAIYTFDKIIGDSQNIDEFITFAKKISDSKSTILITGESGTGKEVFAQAIQNYSPRKNEAFVVINCAAIPRNLIESELFGYEDGAFTGAKRGGQIGKFEIADGGTIFLDEIGEMPLEMQTKLLRVIEEGTIIRVGGNETVPVNVRIIASNNKKLRDEVARGNFRNDLYYRLNVIPMELPPLRARSEDIPLLANYFMKKISHRINKKPIMIDDASMEIIKNYSWPGNVRELENFIELSINKEKLSIELLKNEVKIKEYAYESIKFISLDEKECEYIRKILIKEDFNITNTAKLLGIGRNTLYRKLEKHLIKCSRDCFTKNDCSNMEHCSNIEQ
ncbi:MAG: sigma 54-interacting transcriptional regulator [Acidaminobacteraceae bacterium]